MGLHMGKQRHGDKEKTEAGIHIVNLVVTNIMRNEKRRSMTEKAYAGEGWETLFLIGLSEFCDFSPHPFKEYTKHKKITDS